MKRPTLQQLEEVRQVASSFVASSHVWSTICDLVDDYLRLRVHAEALEIRTRELSQPCVACGHTPGHEPTEELPLVKGALDAQAEVERENFRLKEENARLRDECDRATRTSGS